MLPPVVEAELAKFPLSWQPQARTEIDRDPIYGIRVFAARAMYWPGWTAYHEEVAWRIMALQQGRPPLDHCYTPATAANARAVALPVVETKETQSLGRDLAQTVGTAAVVTILCLLALFIALAVIG